MAVDLRAWEQEPRPKDERLRTHGADEGWTSWNGRSAEREFCVFAKALVKLIRPSIIVETGVGQGYMTRRLAEAMPESSRLLCFESDDEWREALVGLDFWKPPRFIYDMTTPDAHIMEHCELLVADSTYQYRKSEIQLWAELAPKGSYVLVHDVSPSHPEDSVHRRIHSLIENAGLSGVMLSNPRGGFLGRK